MKFYFDESGSFCVPTNAQTQAVGIVSGIVVPEIEEPVVFQRFDGYVSALPQTAFDNGEPKGRLLGPAEQADFATMFADLPGILFCPVLMDLTAAIGNADVRGAIERKFRQLQTTCRKQTLKDSVGEYADLVAGRSQQQILRLVAWAKCIHRCLFHSIIQFRSPKYHPSWMSLEFNIDRVESPPGNNEENVFKTLLPALTSLWSMEDPLPMIEGVHDETHPLIQNWSRAGGFDVGKMFKSNVRYVESAGTTGVQLADMAATIVRKAVLGNTDKNHLNNYGLAMTKSIGKPLDAIGLFNLDRASVEDLDRRYSALTTAISAARKARPQSYSRE